MSTYYFLSRLKNSFDDMAQGSGSSPYNKYKIEYFVCHDVNIAPLLIVFDLLDYKRIEQDFFNNETKYIRSPRFASRLLFELWRDADESLRVVLKYENQSSITLSYQQFSNTVLNLFGDSYSDKTFQKSCFSEEQIQSQNSNNESAGVSVWVLCLVVVIVGVVVYFVQEKRYSSLKLSAQQKDPQYFELKEKL